MSAFLRIMFGLDPPKPTKFARVNLEDWRTMKPGTVNVVTDYEGHQWAVMHLDDFDHLAGVAKLQRRELPVTVSGESGGT